MKKKDDFYTYKSIKFWHRNKNMIVVSAIGLLIIHVFLFTDAYRGSGLNSKNASEFGDFVGGYFGSIFSFISILILYYTLKEQRLNFTIEKFENKLFQMIAHHEHIVTEIGLCDIYGKRIFVWLIREYRLIHTVLTRFIESESISLNVDVRERLNDKKTFMAFAYIIFFFGIGTNSSRILRAYLRNNFKLEDDFIDALFAMLKDTRFRFQEKLEMPFTPFEGHQSRLGDYYRHLFQMVKYVDSCKLDVDKYEYIKNIRAQLSNHEQALLLINSFSSLGQDWWNDNDYICFYRFVSNIPNSFFCSEKEINISTLFPTGYFEYEQNTLTPTSSQT